MLLDIPLWMMKDYHQTGSSIICNPPVTDTDIDFCILVESVEKTSALLCQKGWTVCGNASYDNESSTFQALRKAKLNYILVENKQEYDRWEAAMLLAKHRNLTEKADRVALFRTIKAGVSKPKAKKALFDLNTVVNTIGNHV